MKIHILSLTQRYKRIFQAMTIAIAVIYSSLLVYQSAFKYPGIQMATSKTKVLGKFQIEFRKNRPRGLSVAPPNQPKQKSEIGYKNIHPIISFNLSTQTYHHDERLKLSSNPFAIQEVSVLEPSKQNNVIFRKAILSFNFSDMEIAQHPTASMRYDFTSRSRKLHDLSQRAATATPKPQITAIDDLFISVKTTKLYHNTRLALIIKTWFQLAHEQTWFFTDGDDSYFQEMTKGHLFNTNCSQGHFRKALCCKMSAEFDVFLESGKKWFCHFDDDNYVNVPRLIRLLDDYSPSLDWYLGKPSISSPLEIHLDNRSTTNKKITFWFATGGAGFCLSRALTRKMLPLAGGGKFSSIGDKIRFPDDVTMGFIIEHLLGVPLTVIDNFHSHLEPMEFIRPDTFHDQVSFSYAHMKRQWNVIKVHGFDVKTDPKRFYSLHCLLFPYFSFCPPG